MKRSNHASVVRLTSLALLAALVVVLQTVASGIRIGPVPISLTLVPIVVGAILFGPGAGAGLGAVFGIVCLIAGITGADQFTNVLWVASPFWLVVVCVGKAVLCGLCAGLVDAQLHTRRADGPVREHRRVRHWDAHGLQARSAGLCRRHEHCLFPFRRVYRRELPRRIRRQRRFKRCGRTNCAGCAETA